MNKQEIFDTVATHLLTQNAKSITESNESIQCQYRSPDGLKCAVGCLITDEEYVPEMDNGADHPTDIYSLIERGFLQKFKAHVSFLGEMQNLHDVHPPSSWKYLLKSMALDHGLSTKNVDLLKDLE